MYSNCNSKTNSDSTTSFTNKTEHEFIFSIDKARKMLIDLDEEKHILDEITTLESKINVMKSKKNLREETIRVKYIQKPHCLREFLKLSNSNKSRFENSCKSLSKANKNIELLYKEYTFLSNLTKMRFLYRENNSNSAHVVCYFLKKDDKMFKISIAEFDLEEDRLKRSEIFWRNMSLLYNLENQLFEKCELLG